MKNRSLILNLGVFLTIGVLVTVVLIYKANRFDQIYQGESNVSTQSSVPDSP